MGAPVVHALADRGRAGLCDRLPVQTDRENSPAGSRGHSMVIVLVRRWSSGGGIDIVVLSVVVECNPAMAIL